MSVHREAIFNSFKTIKEMFEARNKHDIVQKLLCISDNELDELSKAKNIFTLDVPTKLRIVYYLDFKMRVNDLKGVMLSENPFENYIVVLKDKTTSSNMSNIHSLDANVQVFELRELQFNISKHVLVPKHRLIPSTDETFASILQKLNIRSRTQLPVILRTDPMARFLNAKSGDLIEITRYSPTSGEHIFYRITA